MVEEFKFYQDPVNKKWTIFAPRRAKRPDIAKGSEPVCPFCPEHERLTPPEIYRFGDGPANQPGWQVRVIPNKFPFTSVHEIVIHSPNHHQNLPDLPLIQVERVLKVYQLRYKFYKDRGQVFIFHNRGSEGGESLPHPHSQISVIPKEVSLETPRLGEITNLARSTKHFRIFCPQDSQWPYEVWIAPKRKGTTFEEVTDGELADFSKTVQEVLQKLLMKLGKNLSFNYYIYPGGNWYWRLIPRTAVKGGFEIGTGIFINTVDPREVAALLKD
jgi:UDPglucose--hexose-1-phosphate uridylyltransferase